MSLRAFNRFGNPLPEGEFGNYYAAIRISGDAFVGVHYVGPIRISTVFLCLDHNHMRKHNDPDQWAILFETMVFGTNEEYEPCDRHHNIIDALIFHAMTVGMYRTGRELNAAPQAN
jgi:hypothetical protein